MSRCRAAAAVVVLVASLLFVAGPAAAGGPTSALLVMPESGHTASLYATDIEYTRLAEQVGAFAPSDSPQAVDRSGAGHEVGSMITVTWLLHDVSVWRIDRIWIGADDGPWIATQVALSEPADIWDSPVVWHTATDGGALMALLDRLGFDGEVPAATGPDAGASSVAGAEDATAGSVPQAGSADDPVAPDAGQTAGWVWVLAGLVLGVALTAAVVACLPALRRSRAARLEPEPDADLGWSIDADGVRVPADTLTSRP